LQTSEKRLLQFYFLFGMYTAPCCAVGYVLQRFFTPCNIVTVGYFLLPECAPGFDSVWSYQSTIVLCIYCCLIFWVFIDTFGIFAFYMTGISFVQAYSIFAYTKYFQKCLHVNLETNRHTFYKLFPVYRQLQLLNRYFNGLQQEAMIFVVLILIPMTVIFGVYTLVEMGSKISTPEFMFFFSSGFDGLVVIIVYFTVMSKVNSGAEDAKKFMRRNVTARISETKLRKWVRVYSKSLQPLRVCVGSVNYVDQLTPFTLLDFCVSQIVSLLLLN